MAGRSLLVMSIALLSGCISAGTMENRSHQDGKMIVDNDNSFAYPKTKEFQLQGDIRSYTAESCSARLAKECEVFVQADPNGSLIGFLTLTRYASGRTIFETDTHLRDGTECSISGSFDDEIFNPEDDFNQRSSFTMVNSGVSSEGMYYLTRKKNRIRVTDERWNYCMADRHIDDVWIRASKLIK